MKKRPGITLAGPGILALRKSLPALSKTILNYFLPGPDSRNRLTHVINAQSLTSRRKAKVPAEKAPGVSKEEWSKLAESDLVICDTTYVR